MAETTLYKVKGANHSWAVYNVTGGRVTRYYASPAWAERMMERLEEGKRARNRPCLCCAQVFHSKGPHNRLCPACQSRPDAAGPSAGLPSKRGGVQL